MIEQLHYNLLFRWFVGLNTDEPVWLWHPTSFTKNRDRLLNEELMAKFLELLLAAPEVKPLLSSEHFSVDGTLLRAWESHSSLERIDGLDDDPPPPSCAQGFGGSTPAGKTRAKGDFRGLLLSNQTHCSTSDGETRLFKKAPGVVAYLSFMGHFGWPACSVVRTRKPWVPIRATTPGRSWQTYASAASRPMWHRTSVAAVDQPLLAAPPAIRATANQSINARKRIEQVFGWIKQAAGVRQLKARSRSKVGAVFRLHVVVYNLIRITKLLRKQAPQEVMA